MAPKRRRFAVLLGSLLFAASIFSVPALATEEGGLVPYTENGDNGAIIFPTNPAPPTPTPEPTPTPTPEPTPSPTPTPEPTPVIDPTPSEEPDDPPYVPDDPTPTPSRSPNGAGTVTPAPTPHPSNRPTPTEQPSVNRPKITPKPQDPVVSSPETTDDGTNYVTFAQLNVKNNSLAITLFYGGLACAVLGAAGLLFLLVRFLRKRRQDEKAAIFREIEAAETRQQPDRLPNRMPELVTSLNHGHPVSHPADAPSYREPVSHPPEPAARQLPASSPSSPASYSSPLERERPLPSAHKTVSHPFPTPSSSSGTGANAPIIPVQASMYTEEFSLPEEEPAASAPKPQMASRLRQSAQRPTEKQAASENSGASTPAAKPIKSEHFEPSSPPMEVPKPIKPEPPAQKKTEVPKKEHHPAVPEKPASSSRAAKKAAEKETESADAQIPGQMSLMD